MAFSLSDRSSLNTYPQNYIFLRSNPSFQPRPNEFKKLTHQLGAESNKARLTKKKRILGLIGLGGIGKSQLAAELAHQYAKEQRFPDGIFWVSMGEELGEGSIGLESLLVRLCANTEYFPPKDNIANPENNALRSRYICKYLAEHSNALLILDDVYDIEAVLGDLTAYAGTDLQCTILYTSRNSNVPAYIMAYTVPPLTPKGALHLLLERRPRMLKERNAQRQDEQEWRSARAICDYVERLPLALSILRDLLRDETLSVTHLWKELNENDVFWTMAARTNISD